MKKTFTLLLAMFGLVCSVNASEPIDFTKISGFAYGEPFTLGGWDWKGVTLSQGNLETDEDARTADDSNVNYFDASSYDYVVVKYSNASADVSLVAQYKCKGTLGDWGAEYEQGSAVIAASSESTYAALALDASQKNTINQIAIQGGGGGATITIDEIYFATEEEWEAVKPAPVVVQTMDILSKFGGTSNDDGSKTFVNASNYTWNGAWFDKYDASEFDYLVVELAEPASIGFNVIVEYNSTSSSNAELKAGELIMKLELNDGKSSVKQVALQNTSIGDFTVKAVYFATKEYVDNMEEVLPNKIPLSLTDLGSGWNSAYDAETKTISIDENAGGGKGWWLSSADYSFLDNVVIQFAETSVEGKVVVEYAASGASSDEVKFYEGATCVVVPLNSSYSDGVKQIYIQGGAGATYTLTDAFVAIEDLTPEANLGAGPIDVVLDENGTSPELAVDKKANVEVKLQFETGWNTFCIPAYMTPSTIKANFGENVKVYTFKGYADGQLNFAIVDLSNDGWVIQGFEPYLVYISDSDVPALKGSFTLTEVAIRGNADENGNVKPGEAWPDESGVAFKGTFETISGSDLSGCYGVLADGHVKKAGPNAYVGGYHAYFTGIPAAAEAKGVKLVIDGAETTGISQVVAVEEVFGNGAVYNLSGQRVDGKNLAPGIYVRNGKKFIVK